MKKILAALLAALMLLSLAACGSSSSAPETTAAAPAETAAPTAAAENPETEAAAAPAEKYVVGVCQLVPHPALDAATQGFVDRLTELLGAENVEIQVKVAAGDSATCAPIVTDFVTQEVDLIMANATPALQAAAAATAEIPILGTSVTEYGVDVELYQPKVPYRETITKVATAQYRHKKQSGGAGQFGEVHLLVCPAEGELNTKFKIDGKDTQLNVKTQDITDLEWGGKLEFYNCVVGGAIDLGFMPAILKGIKEKMSEGPLTGSYARDIRVFVYDGKMHPVDSKEIAFIIAGRNAFKEAFRNAGPKILEPIYNVTVMTPPEYQGAVMSDLQNRRGVLGDMGSDKGFAILKARVPQAELYRYSTSLSSLTAGSASFEKEFADYQPVPGDVQTKLLAEYAAAEAAED